MSVLKKNKMPSAGLGHVFQQVAGAVDIHGIEECCMPVPGDGQMVLACCQL